MPEKPIPLTPITKRLLSSIVLSQNHFTSIKLYHSIVIFQLLHGPRFIRSPNEEFILESSSTLQHEHVHFYAGSMRLKKQHHMN